MLAALAGGLVIALAPGVGALATEIDTNFGQRSANLAPTADPGAEGTFTASPVDTGDIRAPGGILPPDEVAGDADRGTGDAQWNTAGGLAMWLPAIAILPRRDAPLVDPFLLAVAVIHSSGAARLVRDTVWGLQEPDASATVVGLPPLAGNLAERDNVAAAEVAFLLGTVKAPEPDIVFLAFVFLQSLWGLACRPRQN